MPKAKRKDRKKELLLSWNQTKRIVDSVVTAGIENPLDLKKGVLRELIALLSHGSKVISIMASLEEQGMKGLAVQTRRQGIDQDV